MADMAASVLARLKNKAAATGRSHHNLNGTVDTVCQLTGFSEREVYTKTDEVSPTCITASQLLSLSLCAKVWYQTRSAITLPTAPLFQDGHTGLISDATL